MHGDVELIGQVNPHWNEADRACREVYKSSASEWVDDAVYLWLEPATMFAFARDPASLTG